jgi:hypothetical protein
MDLCTLNRAKNAGQPILPESVLLPWTKPRGAPSLPFEAMKKRIKIVTKFSVENFALGGSINNL